MARSPVHHRPHPRSPPPGHHHPPPRGSSPPPYARPPPPHRRLSVSPSRRRPAVRAPGDDVRRRISPPAKDGRRAILPPPNAQSRRPGPSQPRLSDTNRMPVASMRMRMDDYAPPKPRRNDQAAIPPLMEQVVVKARREASTRTKDTFWTKKLLDAEDQYSKRGDRWAHSGFKELYRDELGYEPEPPARPSPPAEGQKRGDSRQRDRPVPRDPRPQPRDPRRASPRPRDPRAKPHDPRQSPDRPRDPRTAPRPPRDPRRPGEAVPSPRRGSRSPRGRKKSPHRRHRRHRSYSGSYSSGSSSSSSTSYSRSRSYYSRSSYSSTGSSSFSSSSSSRSRSRRPSQGKRKRSHSGSYSSSASPPRIRPPVGEPVKKGRALPANVSEGVKKAGALQETTKKVVTKTVSNVVTTKTKILASVPGHSKSSHRGKPKMRIKTDEGDSRKKPSYPQPEPGMEGAVVPTAYYGAPEAGEVAARNGNGGSAAGSSLISSPTNIAPSSSGGAAGPLPHHHHHHHHLPNPKKGGPHMADFSTSGNSGPNQPASPVDDSDSSSSSEEEELPRKMTLSERFGKLAQLSSQRQEYDGVRMKIVREGGQDKKVYLEAGLGSRSPSPLHPGHERWLAEHQTEYAEYQRRYGDIRSWDPHRDLPRDLPPNWEDVGVRYRYYKQSGYFGDRHITLEDYLKWEDWWYQYRDWLKKYGDAAAVDGVARHGKMSELDWDAYDRPRGGRWPADTRDPGIPERKRRRF